MGGLRPPLDRPRWGTGADGSCAVGGESRGGVKQVFHRVFPSVFVDGGQAVSSCLFSTEKSSGTLKNLLAHNSKSRPGRP